MSKVVRHRGSVGENRVARPRFEAAAGGRILRLGLTRHPGDAVRVGLSVAAIASTAVFVHRDRLTVLEADLFRIANDLPGWLFPVFWVVMQLGNFLAVPMVTVVAAITRRFRLATEVAVTGTGVWLLAKVLKQLVVRGRPNELLSGVHIHGAAATGLGYPSGHAAVVTAIATLVVPYLGRRLRRTAVGLAVIVCLARVYVGAHLPLDVLAGAALGWGVASAVHLVFGAPSGRPRPGDVSRALSRLGYTPVSMTSLGIDGRRSALFKVVSQGGIELFAKVVPRERRDRDVLYRIWVRLAHAGHRPEGWYRSSREALEHEALMVLQAARAGVRVPEIMGLGESRHGAGLLLQEWVDGLPLSAALSECGDADAARILADVWEQVATLNASQVSHGALTDQHLLIDGQGRVHIVGFAEAQMVGAGADLASDAADVLLATGALVGEEHAASLARAQLGEARAMAAMDLLGSRRRRGRNPADQGRPLKPR